MERENDSSAFVHRLMKAWNDRNISEMMEMLTEDCVFEPSFGAHPYGDRYSGKAEVQRGAEKNFRDIPDIAWETKSSFATDQHAVIEWHCTGTPVNGQRFAVDGCDVLTLRDGRISAKHSYRKSRL